MELVTPRLRLRPLTSRDAEWLLAHWSLPPVRRWLWDDRVPTRDEIDGILAASAASWATNGYGFWGLEPAATRRLLGAVWFREASWEPGVCELGYSLDPDWWGQGLVTEAAREVLAWAARTHHWPRVVAATDTPNTQSIRVLERLGMQREREGVLENGAATTFFGLALPPE